MGIFSKKIEYRTIEFVDHQKAFDFPKHFPLPRIGELVGYEGLFGRVVDVSHLVSATVSEIRISCKGECKCE